MNPLQTIEQQVGEVLFVHRGLGRAEARARALELLRLVQIQDPEQRLAPTRTSSPAASASA